MIRCLAFAFAAFACACAYADAPTPAQVRHWWDAATPEASFGDPVAVTLVGGEPAYLVTVTDWNRGRNNASFSLLVRPKLRQARELALGSAIEVLDAVSPDAASLVAVTGSGSGQGTTVSVRSLVQFAGWKPLVLRQVRFGDNLGACGAGTTCRSTEATWTLSGGRDGAPLVLDETWVTARGGSPERMARRETTTRYRLAQGRFVPAPARPASP